MKCHRIEHFIKVYPVKFAKMIIYRHRSNHNLVINSHPLICTMNYPRFIVTKQVKKPICGSVGIALDWGCLRLTR